jgi:hypothetical protein
MATNFQAEKYLQHVGHEVEVVTYGLPGEKPVNVSIECVDCSTVLTDEELEV